MNWVTLNYCFIGKTQQFNFMIEFRTGTGQAGGTGHDTTVLTNRNMNFIIQNTNFDEWEMFKLVVELKLTILKTMNKQKRSTFSRHSWLGSISFSDYIWLHFLGINMDPSSTPTSRICKVSENQKMMNGFSLWK